MEEEEEEHPGGGGGAVGGGRGEVVEEEGSCGRHGGEGGAEALCVMAMTATRHEFCVGLMTTEVPRIEYRADDA